jgi:hypothetical protein
MTSYSVMYKLILSPIELLCGVKPLTLFSFLPVFSYHGHALTTIASCAYVAPSGRVPST